MPALVAGIHVYHNAWKDVDGRVKPGHDRAAGDFVSMTNDILIKGGLVFDGADNPGVKADVLVRDGVIAKIASSISEKSARVIDAEGLAVTPGFIDIKTHSDFVLPINPKAESKVRQGVTTEIIGHCGFSVAPVLPGKTQLARRLSESAARRGCRSGK